MLDATVTDLVKKSSSSDYVTKSNKSKLEIGKSKNTPRKPGSNPTEEIPTWQTCGRLNAKIFALVSIFCNKSEQIQTLHSYQA